MSPQTLSYKWWKHDLGKWVEEHFTWQKINYLILKLQLQKGIQKDWRKWLKKVVREHVVVRIQCFVVIFSFHNYFFWKILLCNMISHCCFFCDVVMWKWSVHLLKKKQYYHLMLSMMKTEVAASTTIVWLWDFNIEYMPWCLIWICTWVTHLLSLFSHFTSKEIEIYKLKDLTFV
jgi:hypothetical protein